MNQIRKSKIRGIQAEYCQRAGLEPYGKTFELTVEMWMEMAAAFGLMVIDDEPEDADGDWRPINTAPLLKYVFVLGPCGQIDVALKGYNEWALRSGGFLDYEPTHWAPIPKLPDTKNAAP